MNNRIAILSALLLTLLHNLNCSDIQPPIKKQISYKQVSNTGNKITFGQIEKIGVKKYLVFYSYSFAIGGGSRIEEVDLSTDTIRSSLLLRRDAEVISSVSFNQKRIAYVVSHFRNGSLETSLITGFDSTTKALSTPITGLRQCLVNGDTMVVEGNLDGTGQTFKSVDGGRNWALIHSVEKRFKSFKLFNNFNTEGNIICMGCIGFNGRECKLVSLDVNHEAIIDIVNADTEDSYFKPMCKGNNLHGMVNNTKVTLYNYEKGKMYSNNTFKMPGAGGIIENMYVNDSLYIITETDLSKVKKYTWISYDKGKNWTPHNQESGFQLLFNAYGELWGIDAQNNILHGDVLD